MELDRKSAVSVWGKSDVICNIELPKNDAYFKSPCLPHLRMTRATGLQMGQAVSLGKAKIHTGALWTPSSDTFDAREQVSRLVPFTLNAASDVVLL